MKNEILETVKDISWLVLIGSAFLAFWVATPACSQFGGGGLGGGGVMNNPMIPNSPQILPGVSNQITVPLGVIAIGEALADEESKNSSEGTTESVEAPVEESVESPVEKALVERPRFTMFVAIAMILIFLGMPLLCWLVIFVPLDFYISKSKSAREDIETRKKMGRAWSKFRQGKMR